MTACLSLWEQCLEHLRNHPDIISSQEFDTWIRPLQAEENENALHLLAPNQFVIEWINEKFITKIKVILNELSDNTPPSIVLKIGSRAPTSQLKQSMNQSTVRKANPTEPQIESNLNPNFVFENFVEGKSNQLARAAAMQVAENPGRTYNPMVLYGGVGLGKTHLML